MAGARLSAIVLRAPARQDRLERAQRHRCRHALVADLVDLALQDEPEAVVAFAHDQVLPHLRRRTPMPAPVPWKSMKVCVPSASRICAEPKPGDPAHLRVDGRLDQCGTDGRVDHVPAVAPGCRARPLPPRAGVRIPLRALGGLRVSASGLQRSAALPSVGCTVCRIRGRMDDHDTRPSAWSCARSCRMTLPAYAAIRRKPGVMRFLPRPAEPMDDDTRSARADRDLSRRLGRAWLWAHGRSCWTTP